MIQAHVDLLHQPPHDRRGEEHGDAGNEHGLADHQRAVAAHFGEIARIDVGEAVRPMPTQNEIMQPTPKLRLVKARISTIGSSAVSTR